MKCHDFDKLIDDFVDQDLSPLQNDACRIHIQSCNQCAQKVANLRALLGQMQNLSNVTIRREFKQNLQKEFQPRLIGKKGLYGTIALAACLVLALSLNLLFDKTIHIPLNQAHQIKLLFQAEMNMNNVLFTIEVPKHLEISGFEGNKLLQWEGRLKKGENLLTVPVLGKAQKPGYLIMRIQHKGKHKTLKVRLYPDSDWS